MQKQENTEIGCMLLALQYSLMVG